VLPPDQEEALHEKGEELRRKADWVFDIMRMRNTAENVLKRPKKRS
jgi:hypothetical protein